ncbi:hypothetical protein CALCODRAFT_518429 [Calocera cornea HHB12733]|uniref:Uncharacterized protein n=1 Tax=Calocera cornea HHB12733 TaxID=1353952 RepID=A0A165F095_9BASI|nr:hypothetical protein CALCODRAFT_518429 [Calocera cornea HHB12733]
MQIRSILSIMLSLASVAWALPASPQIGVGSNDLAVLTIAVGVTTTFEATASVLSTLITGPVTATTPAVETAVTNMLANIHSTTTSLAGLGSASVGLLAPEIAVAYLTLVDSYMAAISAASKVYGFIHDYGNEFDASLTGMVTQLDTAVHGVIPAIAADGAVLQGYLTSLHVFYSLNSTIFSQGAI